MGDRSIKKETKKKKKADAKPSASSSSTGIKSAAIEPELIKKEKKHK